MSFLRQNLIQDYIPLELEAYEPKCVNPNEIDMACAT